MRDNVLWRKIARIILLVAQELNINEEDALVLFYRSRVYGMLKDPRYGLQIMSDIYVCDELMMELRDAAKPLPGCGSYNPHQLRHQVPQGR